MELFDIKNKNGEVKRVLHEQLVSQFVVPHTTYYLQHNNSKAIDIDFFG